jgi:hypothetical protein
MMDRARRLAAGLPAPIAGAIDLLRPSIGRGFGPFNGQERRTEAVRRIFARIDIASIMESGTYRATTTLKLRELDEAPIATIEANSRFYYYSRMRLLFQPRVTVFRGDSARVLRRLANRPPWNRNPAFFYLDAHGQEALPLRDELETIVNGWRDFVVLVDDFMVPGDPGYGYDDYGPGRALEPAILEPLVGRAVSTYWPAAPSSSETGRRRGWVVLASSGAMDDALRTLAELRHGGSVDLALDAGSTRDPTKATAANRRAGASS